MKGCTHASTAAFHLQTRDTDGGGCHCCKNKRDREREEGQISSGWSAGVVREREKDLK